MDIIIVVLCFPNHPTRNRTAHQMFVAEQTKSYVDFHSISFILGKEKRVYGKDKENYVTIILPESMENGFKVPSFIDCAKVYQVSAKSINLTSLTNRMISDKLRERINERIKKLREDGRQSIYSISEDLSAILHAAFYLMVYHLKPLDS